MNKFTFLFLTVFSICSFAQQPNLQFEKVTSFYPNNGKIERGYFTVPDVWKDTYGAKIKFRSNNIKKDAQIKRDKPSYSYNWRSWSMHLLKLIIYIKVHKLN
ncbi:hypothetical protein [Flavivirga jejuensis]|uniref:Uncharacterized protein n=1 Tax=Flavivirga jejuensis TaxID=870487 RepID=A0ABT8WKD6_9FLAO|nr:hypothetical protein [Flavivirga jejuensis]MDO5973610.1 hypothetical protein [Flavivirga jejuensis]